MKIILDHLFFFKYYSNFLIQVLILMGNMLYSISNFKLLEITCGNRTPQFEINGFIFFKNCQIKGISATFQILSKNIILYERIY
jgi:hypothetical protein